MIKSTLFYVFAFSWIFRCTHSEEISPIKEPIITPETRALPSVDPKPLEGKEVKVEVDQKPVAQTIRCLPLTENPPFWNKDSGFVVTQIHHKCFKDGRDGFLDNTTWTAMGFPGTGGKGVIKVGGVYTYPKIVSLVLANDSPMLPAVINDQPLGPKAQLAAYTPFAVQYWEIPGFTDADVGFSINLRSIEAKQKLWRDFLNKTPIPVRLVGRENSWTSHSQLFSVAGNLHWLNNENFKLEVIKVEALAGEKLEVVRERCQALTPQRPCSIVFGG